MQANATDVLGRRDHGLMNRDPTLVLMMSGIMVIPTTYTNQVGVSSMNAEGDIHNGLGGAIQECGMIGVGNDPNQIILAV
jgi:hypothetical protein